MGQTLSEPVVEKVSCREIFQIACSFYPSPHYLVTPVGRAFFPSSRSPPCAHIRASENLSDGDINLESYLVLFFMCFCAVVMGHAGSY